MIDPALLSGTPFGSTTAYRDLSGTLFFAHRAISETLSRTLGVECKFYPLGEADITSKSFLSALQQQHNAEAQALGLALSPDLQSYNLNEEEQFTSWTFVVANDLARIKIAAGV